jgi:hypothetical protein
LFFHSTITDQKESFNYYRRRGRERKRIKSESVKEEEGKKDRLDTIGEMETIYN